MKNLILFFTLLLLSFVSKAQISAFNNANYDLFYGIGGYSFSQQYFMSGVRPNPDVVTGPSPQNDFTYTVSADGGIQHVYTYISTLSVNKSINFEFKNNNVKKFGCRVTAVNIHTGQSMADLIVLEATTNLGNVVTTTGSQTDFVGFNVMGGENEYITTITATFQSPSANSIAINSITIGDNTPQNVALSFDGVDDFVVLPSQVSNIHTTMDFTVTCWIKPDPIQTTQNGTNPDENDIISKWAGLGSFPNDSYPFVIRYLNQNQTDVNKRGRIRVGQWDGTNFPFIDSTTPLDDEKWHHVAFVRIGGVFKLYIDGIQEGPNTTDNASGSVSTNTPLFIGRRANGESHFKGEIDEVRLWDIGKTDTEIANERFCKTPNPTDLRASFNFNNGVPHGNNALIMQVQNDISTYHGTLYNFDKTGDVSNFVTGEVKYVNIEAGDGNYSGSSWVNGFLYLQDALTSNPCNDLFDVYVSRGTYKPSTSGDVNASFNIPEGMRAYGGFAGTEKSINHRNLALIHTTNETTLTGDLASNDILSDFFQNRSDNSKKVVQIYNKSNILIDGFSIRGGNSGGYGGGIDVSKSQNISVKNCKIYDNRAPYGGGVDATGANNLIFSNCTFLGNRANYYGDALYLGSSGTASNINLFNCIVAGHIGNAAILADAAGGPRTHSYTNCTFANNNRVFGNQVGTGTINFSLKNSIIYGNTNFNQVSNSSGTYNESITYSLVQGVTSGTGNLNGNTTNPQFVDLPAPGATPSTAGDYRLKWCSKAIGVGTNDGISSLDLDRNPRNFGGTADMGAFEFLGNVPSQVNNSTITGTIDSPTYAGGAIQAITSTAKILAPAGSIDFKAPNSITLNPGFEARGVSKYFKAEIGANLGCNN